MLIPVTFMPWPVQGRWQLLALVLMAMSPLAPVSAQQVCTPDPLGGEVCVPGVDTDADDAAPAGAVASRQSSRPKLTPLTPMVGVPADVIFERMPFRSFKAAPAPEEFVETEVEVDVEVEQENAPIRGLWNKRGELDDGDALEYVEGAVRDRLLSQSNALETQGADPTLVRFDGVDYIELTEPMSQLYAQPYANPGWSVWVRGYGGEDRFNLSSASQPQVDVSTGGVVLGVDVDLSEEVRVGLYGNYSSADADHNRGSWSPDGWGGGITADWWSESFYVQGLVGGNSFSGTHSRDANGSTYTGDRSGQSWNAALRLGAPIDAGGLYLEPQAQVSWMGVALDRFSEGNNDRDQRLTYSSRNADFLGTQLALKLATPIRSGERSLWMPSLRLGWIANWGQGNDPQVVRASTGGSSYSYATGTDDGNGLLVEAGLDVSTYNFNDTSVAVFVRGGPVFWGNDLGTSWRAWGGVTFQF